jgi:hypothetical protein
MLHSSSVELMLERPQYEAASSRDWYGLGLDVLDFGSTFGHTGAMEGTCGTVQHYSSRLTWVFLLNAWAADMDLDGVVKFALSSAGESLSPFPKGLVTKFQRFTHRDCVAEVQCISETKLYVHETNKPAFEETGADAERKPNTNLAGSLKEIQNQMTCISTQDGKQCILLSVPYCDLKPQVTALQRDGFSLTWVGVNLVTARRNGFITFTAIFYKTSSGNGDRGDSSKSESLSSDRIPEETLKVMTCDEKISRDDCSDRCVTRLDTNSMNTENDHQSSPSCEIKCLDRMFVNTVAEKQKNTFLLCDHCEFVNHVKAYSSQGYHPEVITTFATKDGIQTFAVLGFTCQEPPQVDIDVPADKYVQLLRKRKQQGFCVFSQCAYENESQMYVTAIMKKCETERRLQQNVETESEETLLNKCNPAKKLKQESVPAASSEVQCSGFLPNNNTLSFRETFEPHKPFGCMNKVSDRTRDCKISKKNHRHKAPQPSKNLSWVQMTVDSFLAELGRQARHGCSLIDVHFYPAGGSDEWYVSGVWFPAQAPIFDCYHRMSVSSFGLVPALAEAASRNVCQKFLCQYEEEGILYHALFWDAGSECSKT